MSDETDASQPQGGPAMPPGTEELTPEQQEELQRRFEEQIKQVRVEDLVLESAASIVNLTARRIAKEDERDLDQARVGIEAVRGMVAGLGGEGPEQLKQALSELQLLYARYAEGGEGDAAAGAPEAAAQGPAQPAQGAGQGEPPPRLWTPGR